MHIFRTLGFLATFVLQGKTILQDICQDLREEIKQDSWNFEVNQEYQDMWNRWKIGLSKLKGIALLRCYKPIDFGPTQVVQVHIFSDAPGIGYRVTAYLRLIHDHVRIYCSFIIGKARVCPLKAISIPHVELTSAVVAAHIGSFIKN